MHPDQNRLESARLGGLLFEGAHTAYRFSEVDLEDETLTRIYDEARWPPTSMNIQPLRVLYVREGAKERLLPHLDEGNRHKTASASVAAVLCYDEEFTRYFGRLLPDVQDPWEDFPDAAAVREAARFNSALQAGYFILAARSMGLAVGPLGGFDPAGARRELLPAASTWEPFLVVNLGRPTTDSFRPRRPRLDAVTATAIIRD